MRFEGLLNGDQHCAGYFTTMDFVFLFHLDDGDPNCIGVFLFDDTKVKQVREAVEAHRAGEFCPGAKN